jgi:hypothetical protein
MTPLPSRSQVDRRTADLPTDELQVRARRRTAATLAAVILGTLLIQAAWALVVPPFRGLDEHEHVYRAAAVARGDWGGRHEASEQGWGEFVVVPDDIVKAANPVCQSLPYTTPDNCSPGEHRGEGQVTVASSAARYNPVFYFVVGTAALPFTGVDAVYAMRAATALICATLIGLAAVAIRRWARSPWPMAALLLAGTPMMLYSTAVAAPNGVEVSSALLVWAAMMGLVRGPDDPRTVRAFLVLATVGAIPLTTVKQLGPLWLLLIALTAMLLMPRKRLMGLLGSGDFLMCVAAVLVATILGVGWTLHAGAIDASMGASHFEGSPWSVIPGQWGLWFMQSIGAFPAQDDLAPPILYAIALVALWVFLAVAWRVANWSIRRALLMVVMLASAVPIAATVTSFEQIGTFWQGRYGYPYAMGFILICGYALDRHEPLSNSIRAWPVWAACAVGLTIELIGQLDVLAEELRSSPLSATNLWQAPAPGLVIALNLAGAGLLAWALSRPVDRDGRFPMRVD